MRLPLTPIRFKQRAAQFFGRKEAIICGGHRLTYTEFDQRCNRLSASLLRLGVRSGDRVAFLSPNCHRLLEAYYAVPQIGAVLLPLNIRLTLPELISILRDAAPRLLFYAPEFAAEAAELARAGAGVGGVGIERAICLEQDGAAACYEDLLREAPIQSFDWTALDEDSIAELFYTSGTTAHPKGVMLSHRSLYLHALYVAHARKIGDADSEAYCVPLFHVNSWGSPHTLTLSGARHVILRKFDPEALLALIAREKVTRLQMVPSMAIALINSASSASFDLASVTEINIGGAPSNVALMSRVQQLFPGAVVAGGYGLTETSPVVSIAYLKDHLKQEKDEDQLRRKSTAGYPTAGVEIRITSPGGNDELPWDGQTPGELLIRGDAVMSGYRNQPAETERAIDAGWLRTGDLATIDPEGYIQIVDRLKDMVLSGGENIATAEVERVICRHPDVVECAVIAVPDERWGEVPKALVVLRPGASATESGIIEFCRQDLAGFKAPKSVEFRDSLPKGGTGKILKRLLREPYWAGQERRVH